MNLEGTVVLYNSTDKIAPVANLQLYHFLSLLSISSLKKALFYWILVNKDIFISQNDIMNSMKDNQDFRQSQAEWQAPKEPEQNTAWAELNSTAEQLVAQSGFEEWCRLIGCANPGSYTMDNLTPEEKMDKYDAAFREGTKRFMEELKDPKNSETKLIDRLNLPKLKLELDALRANGDVLALGKREEEVAKSFQQAISEYTYNREICHAAEILEKKQMNCVGASLLGGRLLDEVGIKYLVGHIGSHVFLILATSDGRIVWQDMQDGKEKPAPENEELTAEKIEGKKSDNTNITPADVVAFANNPKNEGMTFFVKKEYWKNKPLKVLPPNVGLELQELISTGFMLGNRDKNLEAIEVLKLASQKDAHDADIHQGIARAYKNLGQYKKAIGACNKALEIEPGDSHLKKVMAELKTLAAIAKS